MVPDDRYRLAPVHDARTRTERVKRGDLAVAVGDARTTEIALAAAISRVARARSALAAAVACDQTSLRTRLLAERYIARRRRDLADAIAEELRASAAHHQRVGVIDEARRVLARARAEREVIERHFAKWREDRRKLAERRED